MSDPTIYRRLAALEKAVQLRADRPATTATAYTPEYYGGTTAGDTTYAGGGQLGSYVVAGAICVVTVRVEWTAATGTGEARVSIPVVASAAGAAIVYPVNVGWTGDYLIAQITAAADYVNFRGPTTTTPGVLNVEAAGILQFTLVYPIA